MFLDVYEFPLVHAFLYTVAQNREYKFSARADFIPFPQFSDEDNIFGNSTSVSVLDLEIGLKYQYTSLMTIDGSIQTLSGKAKFDSGLYREHLRDSWSQRRLTGNSGSSMIRVMVIATVIAGLIYWIFN